MDEHNEDGLILGTPSQITALADVLAITLPTALAEAQRGGNPGAVHLASYQLGAEGLIATVRGIAGMLNAGVDPLVAPEVKAFIQKLGEELDERGGKP